MLSEDIGPGKMGLSESLYGERIVRGDKPIDALIFAVEMNFMDWDINDHKFQALAKKTLGKVPTQSELTNLISQSSQTDQLKQILIQKSTNQPATNRTPTTNPQTTKGGFGQAGEIVMKSGNTIQANLIKQAMGRQPFYRIGIGKGPVSGAATSYPDLKRRNDPDFWIIQYLGKSTKIGRHKYIVTSKFKKIITANPANVQSITFADGTKI